MFKFKKVRMNKKYYGSNYYDCGCTYNVISDGLIVSKLNELCKKYNAEITRLSLTSDGFLNDKYCIVKMKAHRKDFKNIVQEFTLYFIKYIQDVKY